MSYHFEAEIHVARANIRDFLGLTAEATQETCVAKELAFQAAHDHAYVGDAFFPNTMSDCLIDASEEGFYDGERHREWDEAQRIDEDIKTARKAALKAAYPDLEKCGGLWVYCPRGHNTIFSPSGMDECAACGAVMTPDDESYFDALCAAGQCM